MGMGIKKKSSVLGKLGPRQLGPGVHLFGAQLSAVQPEYCAPDSWAHLSGPNCLFFRQIVWPWTVGPEGATFYSVPQKDEKSIYQ